MGKMLQEALKRSLKPAPSGCCTCLCCRADKMNLLMKALEDVAAAKMPGEARRIAVTALAALGLSWGGK